MRTVRPGSPPHVSCPTSPRSAWGCLPAAGGALLFPVPSHTQEDIDLVASCHDHHDKTKTLKDFSTYHKF